MKSIDTCKGLIREIKEVWRHLPLPRVTISPHDTSTVFEHHQITGHVINLHNAKVLSDENNTIKHNTISGNVQFSFNPFATELATNTHADLLPFYCLWCHQFWLSRITLSADLCRVKRSFKPYQSEHNSVKDTRERGKKPCNIDLKISMKILFHYPPTFPFI